VYGASFVDNENILESESNDSPQFWEYIATPIIPSSNPSTAKTKQIYIKLTKFCTLEVVCKIYFSRTFFFFFLVVLAFELTQGSALARQMLYLPLEPYLQSFIFFLYRVLLYILRGWSQIKILLLQTASQVLGLWIPDLNS
jgi:hypothetical protein